ncbi:F0F1 ATP synthase subunit B [Thermoactinomyces sp. DSM 45892]|uniref:F0F1 ATP synthase subunit B n=1 Tax=Thermoactinomyces sp. DSM 45892 TaxID=1882753 RepID=UPI00089CDCEF|nr:F0F1 ATP synthase subunit B [Thermoactinomyces sp. DSM 45892]SDY41760.1 ATP synthase F0 subcomplex B subunit [Thermoactinomyces sp. DSM 45892]
MSFSGLGTSLVQLAIIFILVLLVSKYALRPLLATMNERTKHIEGQISTAEKNRADAEKLVAEQKELLIATRAEAKEIIDRAKAQKEVEADKIMDRAKSQADQMLADAKKEIELEKMKALASLREEVGALSVQLAEKLVGETLDQKKQANLVNAYLDQVGRLQ